MATPDPTNVLASDPYWYKDAIIYQVHVRAFYDSDGDGIGDFTGLTAKLDYLQELGVSALWLLPFYPSPLRDDGYDIADYNDINPMYGDLSDFKVFLREAHARGLRVITELVLNHTSDQHPWFQRARRAKVGSSHRNFYVWSDTPHRYPEARIIFKDFELSNWSWDPVAKAYFWHRFYTHQPDLNFDNPAVHEALFAALDYWLKLGVDGLRLDAVPYLYERDGTNCENLPETHQFLKVVRQRIDQRYADRMLLAEANQWPEDAIAYFGEGDECHTAFHFPLMPRMFMSIQMEDRFPIIDILQQTPPIPGACQWMVFLRNHDELTLEMVTDEERDYMYRVYAHDRQARINLGIRRRLAPLMGNNRRKIELMNGILFSLPGTPVIYYGDEIGMGDNIFLGDRNGVRTPMQWSADRNAGFSRANPQRLYLPAIIDPEYHYESINVETQNNNPQSLLWWMKRLIALRQRFPAFSRGALEFLTPENRKVLAYLRSFEGETILVVANLSRYPQFAELDLSSYEGATPIELGGHTRFPKIGKVPYLLTVGPHSFYWFLLEPAKVEAAPQVVLRAGADRNLSVSNEWTELLRGRSKLSLEKLLRSALPSLHWFDGADRAIQTVRVTEAIPVSGPDDRQSWIAIIEVEYLEGEPQQYLLPLRFATAEQAEQLITLSPQAVLAHVRVRATGDEGVLFDALFDMRFTQSLLESIQRRRRYKGPRGELVAAGSPELRKRFPPGAPVPGAQVIRGEQSNASIVYDEQFVLKIFRRWEAGENPDLEIGRYLTETGEFPNAPPVLGAIEYRRDPADTVTVGILRAYVPNEGNAWRYTLDTLSLYYETVLADPARAHAMDEVAPGRSLVGLTESSYSHLAQDLFGAYLSSAELLGRRTAQMHLALARETDDPRFAPEPITQLYLRSVFQSMRKQAINSLQLLRRRMANLDAATQADAQQLRDREKQLLQCLGAVTHLKTNAVRTRIHGDYRLAQVLYTGKDFHILDFEGNPNHSLGERRLKRSPLRDVASMIRSFHYAAFAAMLQRFELGTPGGETVGVLRRAAWFWYLWTSSAFLREYLEVAADSAFLPATRDEVHLLLRVYLLDQATGELANELAHRPEWVEAPIRGIVDLLDVTHCGEAAADQ